MNGIRAWKQYGAVLGALAVAGAVGIGYLAATTALGSDETPHFELRGQPARAQTFSLGGVQPAADQTFVDSVRHRAFDTCMARKGFTARPDPSEGATSDYASRYGEAAIGDDGTATGPPASQSVKLPDGSTIELAVTWTPDSCMYRSYAELGSDPIYREALRQRMQVLLHQADAAAVERLQDETSDWKACAHLSDVNGYDLLRTADEVASKSGAVVGDPACMSDDLRARIHHVRGEAHLDVAANHSKVVQAWAALVDRELAAARSLTKG